MPVSGAEGVPGWRRPPVGDRARRWEPGTVGRFGGEMGVHRRGPAALRDFVAVVVVVCPCRVRGGAGVFEEFDQGSLVRPTPYMRGAWLSLEPLSAASVAYAPPTKGRHDSHSPLYQLRTLVPFAAHRCRKSSLAIDTEYAFFSDRAAIGKLDNRIKRSTAKLDVFMGFAIIAELIRIFLGTSCRKC